MVRQMPHTRSAAKRFDKTRPQNRTIGYLPDHFSCSISDLRHLSPRRLAKSRIVPVENLVLPTFSGREGRLRRPWSCPSTSSWFRSGIDDIGNAGGDGRTPSADANRLFSDEPLAQAGAAKGLEIMLPLALRLDQHPALDPGERDFGMRAAQLVQRGRGGFGVS